MIYTKSVLMLLASLMLNKQNWFRISTLWTNITLSWRACLHGTVTTDTNEFCDLRYLYVNEHRIGHYTCGVAFESMMEIFRQHRLNESCGGEWHSAVHQSSKNPLVQGFLAERIYLNHIVTHGLQAVDPRLGQMDQAFYKTQPNWDHMLLGNKEQCLYVPMNYNFRAVDSVRVLLDHKAMIAHPFLLHITIHAAQGI